ncbi:LLM class F420-dependent oxidoreductase [Streptomyces sp. WAC 06783]|uniref:LLM class flavin-dependent oxidoreductase n=1 Tax=Streptomyces sp. WAC 06783 TaxID=2203211 RepID=UPI000F739EAE|nr:LLM class flavin-dependent oxidoreductase [Streptomyces sp. WAC 06783]RSO06998.1 LLM class F420-dependent oxidoreductase [Streptomyces sp. WAC 06783]
MRFELELSNFSALVTDPHPAARLLEVGQRAESAGFERLALPDHLWWAEPPLDDGTTDRPVLDPFTTLGLLAGATQRIELGLLVAGVHLRHPAMLIKQVATLDVLSNGRACLGVGAGWCRAECDGLGIPFPSADRRFAMLEDTLQLAHLMWKEEGAGYSTASNLNGRTLQVPRALSAPAPRQRPHPPILIGGSGPRRTIPLMARYADEANLIAVDDTGTLQTAFLQSRLERLTFECIQAGRDPGQIVRSAALSLDTPGSTPGEVDTEAAAEMIKTLTELGFQSVVLCDPSTPHRGLLDNPDLLDKWADHVMPAFTAAADDPPAASTLGLVTAPVPLVKGAPA